MRNILKGYHERVAINVTLSAGTGGTATYVPGTGQPALSSIPIGSQIQLVKIQGVDTYVFLHNGSEIGSLTITPSSGYNLDSVAVNSTTVTSTPITLQDGDAINVAFRVSEILLASSPHQGYEMVWDGIDSIGFKFQNVYTYDSSYQSHYYSGEIWISDTDYGMPTLNQMGIYPSVVPTEQENAMMRMNGGNALYIPGNTDIQNTYENSSWAGTIDLSTYDGTPSSDWANAHFVGTTEWQIICNIFTNYNEWETPNGTSFAQITGAQIPGTVVSLSAYAYVTYDPRGGGITLRSDGHLGYIPGDYSTFASSGNYRTAVIEDIIPALPDYRSLMIDVGNPNKNVDLGKMRMLNTAKTNYSLAS